MSQNKQEKKNRNKSNSQSQKTRKDMNWNRLEETKGTQQINMCGIFNSFFTMASSC
jgi:hypothetical protein